METRPGGGGGFYEDDSRTGGALVDLHIHDADFVRWVFGAPDELRSTGTTAHVTTLYRYLDGPAHVVAEGGWDHSPGAPFKMRYVVVFDEATADFDLGRDDQTIEEARGRVRRQGFDAHRWLSPGGLAALPHGGATQKALSLLDVSPRE